MEGSAPPFSQELLCARNALQDVNKIIRLHHTAPIHIPKEDLSDIMEALARQEEELTVLAYWSKVMEQ